MTIEKCHRCIGDPACENQVAEECLPVGAFGNLLNKSVEAVTIGLNPALNEFYEQGYKTLKPENQRLTVLSDYQTTSRASLSDAVVEQAKDKQKKYFITETRECHSYFRRLQPRISDLNSLWTFVSGKVAHIDLVACATQKSWSWLSKNCQATLRINCRENFLNTLSLLPNGTFLLAADSRVIEGMARNGLILQQTTKLFNPALNRCCVGKLKLEKKEFPVVELP